MTSPSIRAEDDAELVPTLDPKTVLVLANDYKGPGLEVADYTTPEHGELVPLYDDGKHIAFSYTRDPQYPFTDEYFAYRMKRGDRVSNEAFVYLQAGDPPPPIRISVVDFLENLPLKSDPKAIPGISPLPGTKTGLNFTEYATTREYYDYNADGQITAPTDHAFPLAYVRETKVELSGTLKVVGPGIISPFYYFRVKVKASGDLTINPVNGIILEGGRSVWFSGQSDTELPGQLGIDDDFKIDWEISFDSGATWQSAGSSSQKLYRTLAAPEEAVKGRLYETIVWLGSSHGAGATSPAQVVTPLWAEFASLSVQSLNGATLKYWDSPDFRVTVATEAGWLIAKANGQCGSWVEIFRDALWAQGIGKLQSEQPALRYEIKAKPAGGPAAGKLLGLAVKNWTFTEPGSDHGFGSDFRYELDSEAIDVMGLAGQSKQDPVGRFSNHFVIIYNGTNYDPSYGKTFAGTREWENASLAGIFIGQRGTNPQTSNYLIGGIMKKKDTSKDETDFILSE